MEVPPSSHTLPPTPATSNYPVLYYGLIVVATAAIVLLIYHLVIVKWCPQLTYHMRPPQRISCGQPATPTTWGSNNLVSFKYKGEDDGGDSECAVCLTVFDQGQDIKQLPNCKHFFHAPCIDMWLYSHVPSLPFTVGATAATFAASRGLAANRGGFATRIASSKRFGLEPFLLILYHRSSPKKEYSIKE